jgi:hypothetical protein
MVTAGDGRRPRLRRLRDGMSWQVSLLSPGHGSAPGLTQINAATRPHVI